MDDESQRAIIGIVEMMFELAFSISPSPIERAEKQNKAMMGVRSMCEDILSVEKSERARTTVEKAVRTFLDRHHDIIVNQEEALVTLVDGLCETFGISE